MTQEELIKIVKQLNHVDLQGEAKDELTAKVLQMAADSVTLETLKNGKKVKIRLYFNKKGDQKYAGEIP